MRNELALEQVGSPQPSAALDIALTDLDQLDREIIRLLHWEGFSQEEVASILKKPAGTVRSRYARAVGAESSAK